MLIRGLALAAWVAYGRRVVGSFKVSPIEKDQRVYYIDKFACSIGECKYNVRAGIHHPEYALQKASGKSYYDIMNLINQNKELLSRRAVTGSQNNDQGAAGDSQIADLLAANHTAVQDARMVIRVVLDDEWDRSHHLAPCKRAELGRGRTTLTIPLDGSMGPWSTNSFRQSHRPHFWYFFGEDCRNSVTTQLVKLLEEAGPPINAAVSSTGNAPIFQESYELMYEIEMLQTDGGHLSFELKGMLFWNVLQIGLYLALLVYSHVKQIRIMKAQRFSLHLMIQILNFSCLLHLLASVLSCIYLYQVNKTGAAFSLLEGLCDSCFTISHVMITSCLILIAMGITLNAPQTAAESMGWSLGGSNSIGGSNTTFGGSNPIGSGGATLSGVNAAGGTGGVMSMSLVKVIGGLICLAHCSVVLLDKYWSDPRYKYYGIEGSVGWILVTFRFGLYALFIICFQRTISHPRTPTTTQKFLRTIFWPSSIYFLSLPLLVIATTFIKSYHRHAFLYHSTTITHIVATVMLGELFLNKGEYFKLSQMSQSFLPGGLWKPTLGPHHVD